MKSLSNLLALWNRISLVKQIIIGLAIGIILAIIVPKFTVVSVLGELFVRALKAIAPILVLFLVASAIAQHRQGQKTNLKTVVVLYIVSTLAAGTTAVFASFIFPVKLTLVDAASDITPPGGIAEVFHKIMFNVVANPIDALLNANFLGVLAWAILLGIALRFASDSTKNVIKDISEALTSIIRWVIKFAPLGVMGLVFSSISAKGLKALFEYGKLIILLVCVMVFVALVINPLIVFITCRRNPYPLVLRCIKDSGITAFFTRSSAANIPVNLELCEDMNLDKDSYSISIPLGATINMGGAAVTISILTLAAVHTLDIQVDLPTALILCVMSAISACGASGVAGGSLLLIPMAASLFGIPSDIAMQVVGVGFVVGVVQDSCETALNSSTDVILTATAEYRRDLKENKNKKEIMI